MILIVGAGPAGLTFAIELYRRGIPFRIIDKKIKPVATSNALVAQTRTLEIWDDMGLLEEALSRGNKIKTFSLFNKNNLLAAIHFSMLESPHPFVLGISQHETENML